MISLILEISLVAFILNGIWEFVQCAAFIHLLAPATLPEMVLASLGDVVLTWVSVVAVALYSQSGTWFLARWTRRCGIAMTLLNLGLGIGVEWIALYKGRWAYKPFNPIFPVLNVSILPLFQLMILVPLTLWLVRKRNVARLSRLTQKELAEVLYLQPAETDAPCKDRGTKTGKCARCTGAKGFKKVWFGYCARSVT